MRSLTARSVLRTATVPESDRRGWSCCHALRDQTIDSSCRKSLKGRQDVLRVLSARGRGMSVARRVPQIPIRVPAATLVLLGNTAVPLVANDRQAGFWRPAAQRRLSSKCCRCSALGWAWAAHAAWQRVGTAGAPSCLSPTACRQACAVPLTTNTPHQGVCRAPHNKHTTPGRVPCRSQQTHHTRACSPASLAPRRNDSVVATSRFGRGRIAAFGACFRCCRPLSPHYAHVIRPACIHAARCAPEPALFPC
jgi:hypothetical protein